MAFTPRQLLSRATGQVTAASIVNDTGSTPIPLAESEPPEWRTPPGAATAIRQGLPDL
jgi:hypothetical protein